MPRATLARLMRQWMWFGAGRRPVRVFSYAFRLACPVVIDLPMYMLRASNRPRLRHATCLLPLSLPVPLYSLSAARGFWSSTILARRPPHPHLVPPLPPRLPPPTKPSSQSQPRSASSARPPPSHFSVPVRTGLFVLCRPDVANSLVICHITVLGSTSRRKSTVPTPNGAVQKRATFSGDPWI